MAPSSQQTLSYSQGRNAKTAGEPPNVPPLAYAYNEVCPHYRLRGFGGDSSNVGVADTVPHSVVP